MTEIADNEPKLFDDLLFGMLDNSNAVARNEKLTLTQKLSYLDLIASLCVALPGRVTKGVEKVKVLMDIYLFVLYHGDPLNREKWLDEEVD